MTRSSAVLGLVPIHTALACNAHGRVASPPAAGGSDTRPTTLAAGTAPSHWRDRPAISRPDGSAGNVLKENTASGNHDEGFVLVGASGNRLVRNTADGNVTHGFAAVEGSGDNTFIGNRAADNLNGFVLADSDTNVLLENTANRNHDGGFVLLGADSNRLAWNTANGNVNNGFAVVEGSSINTIRRNTAYRNGAWDAVEDGSGTGNVWLWNSFGTTSGI